MLDVERWAELRREHFVRGVPIKELVRQTGLSRNTVRVRRTSFQIRAAEPAKLIGSPSPGNIAQLQPLATSLQSAFIPLSPIAAGGSTSVTGTSSLSSWASGRVAAAARASAAANLAAQRKEVQRAASKAATQAVAIGNSGSSASPPSYGVQSLPDQCGSGVSGSAGVSCAFAENAFYEYWNATGGNPTLGAGISAWSAEGQAYYPLSCGSGGGVVDCTGSNARGVFLDARFTQAAVSAYTQSQAATYAASGKPGPNG